MQLVRHQLTLLSVPVCVFSRLYSIQQRVRRYSSGRVTVRPKLSLHFGILYSQTGAVLSNNIHQSPPLFDSRLILFEVALLFRLALLSQIVLSRIYPFPLQSYRYFKQ